MDEREYWSALLTTLVGGESLTADDTAWAMDRIMSGEATSAQIAGLAVALRAKGETVAEVSGLAQAMMEHATRISVPAPCVDLVGTGGDRAHTVNISTMGAVVAAASGTRVVKHGNRAASSACGAADLLEHLGVTIDLEPSHTAALAETVGVTFCFAPLFHPALRHAGGPRRELGMPTVFNFLGPLTNPAAPPAQAVGVADPRMCPIVAGVLAERGASALVFRGHDGLDELTTSGPSSVWVVHSGAVAETTLDPAELGIAYAPQGALRGSDADYNASVAREVFAGQPGPVLDAVLLNAAAAVVAARAQAAPDRLPVSAGETGDLREALLAAMREGLQRCRAAVQDGSAAALLERWVRASSELAAPAG